MKLQRKARWAAVAAVVAAAATVIGLVSTDAVGGSARGEHPGRDTAPPARRRTR
jgi:hypothetical protein